MECRTCLLKQHFNCASIKNEEERNAYLMKKEKFICSQCIITYNNNETLFIDKPVSIAEKALLETTKNTSPMRTNSQDMNFDGKQNGPMLKTSGTSVPTISNEGIQGAENINAGENINEGQMIRRKNEQK